MNLRFGPAGLGPVKTALNTLEKYNKIGIKACEIAFTYNVYIKEKDAETIGKKAEELDIELSIHAPYFVNLNSSEEIKIEATKKRILDCCKIGEILGAKVVVFHPGYYGNIENSDNYSTNIVRDANNSSKNVRLSLDSQGVKRENLNVLDYSQNSLMDNSEKRIPINRIIHNKEQAYSNIKNGILNIMQVIKKNQWKIKIAPETMGKVNVFGSIEEISNLVKNTGCSFCIDFAHILARDKKVDYAQVERLFPSKEWHIHFSGIVYEDKGEKHHKKTETEEWRELLKNLPKDRKVRIINESPEMLEDSLEGMRIAKGFGLI